VIVGPSGWLVAGPASREAEEIVYAHVNLSDARHQRNWNTLNQVLRDRRTDIHGEMLGADIECGWY